MKIQVTQIYPVEKGIHAEIQEPEDSDWYEDLHCEICGNMIQPEAIYHEFRPIACRHSHYAFLFCDDCKGKVKEIA